MTVHQVTVNGHAPFACAEDEKVLIVMERLGRDDIFVGCRGGGCGICKVRVTSGAYRTGKMSKLQVSDEEAAAGYALACRIYPLGDLKLELCS